MDNRVSLRERVIKELEGRRNRILNNQINCIPLPFQRFRSELPGIEQGKYYLISGATKSSKTQLTNYLFVYNSILYSYYNPDKLTPTIFYYPLEETKEAITLRFMSYLLYVLSGKRVSPLDLKSTNADKPLSEDILELLKSKEYEDILNFYEEHITFKTARNPTGIWKDLKQYAESSGTIHKKQYKYKDDFGREQIGEAFDYYTPNNPNEYVFIIVDHISLLELERGLDLRQCINKLSEYMIILRNRYKFIPVIVHQQSTETSSLDAFKNNKIRPTMVGLSDSKYTAKDCNVMIGITNPFSFELPEYLGYNIRILKGNFRCMEIVLNRDGTSNSICPLFFDGAINYFKELPKPNSEELGRVYYNVEERRKDKTLIAYNKKRKKGFINLNKFKH